MEEKLYGVRKHRGMICIHIPSQTQPHQRVFFLPIRDLQLSLTNGSKVADTSVKECRSFIELPWCKSLQINVL